MMVRELHYSPTNTYLITGTEGALLFDTGWAGTFRAFCSEMGRIGMPVQKISCILISHFHPDHCGIAQEIADCGPVIAAADLQRDYIHAADEILLREPEKDFHPIEDQKIRFIDLADSRAFLKELGIDGVILATPGHSDDSISLCLDDGSFFVGDLNPLYELEMHRGAAIGKSWDTLLSMQPKTIYYGHARTAKLADSPETPGAGSSRSREAGISGSGDAAREYDLVSRIIKYTDKGYNAARIQKKTGAPADWISDVMRMYLTHTDISVQGILDRMEIRNR